MLYDQTFCRSSVSSRSSCSSRSFGAFASPVFPSFFQQRKRAGLNSEDGYVGAGIILVRFPPNAEPEYLLLCGADTGIWSFPKGHCEDQDQNKPFCTAVRETYEETGFIYTQNYTILGDMMRFGKRFYWIGVMTPASENMPVRMVRREHQQSGWFTFSEISQIRGNHDVRVWTKKTEESYCMQLIRGAQKRVDRSRSTLCSCPCPGSFSTLDMHLNASDHNVSSASDEPEYE